MDYIIKLMSRVSKGTAEKFPLYVKRIDPQKVTVMHKHDFIELIIVFSGSGVHKIGGTSQNIGEGDIFVFGGFSITSIPAALNRRL